MANDPMDGPLLKVERADYHIGELEAIFRRYIAANAKAMRSKKNRHGGERAPIRFGTKFPRHLPAVIGDAIHNLRVSLDHAYWIMVENNGGVFDRHVTFPFGGDFKSVKGSLNGKAKSSKPHQKVVDFILDDLQPFPGGRHDLYDLHTLDITDKHQLLIPTMVGLHLTDTGTLTAIAGDRRLQLVGHREGSMLVSRLADGGSIISAPPGWERFEYSGNLQNALTILFGEGPFDGRPVLDTLRTLSKNVASAVKALGSFHVG